MTTNKESTRYYSNLQEDHVANLIGGKKVPGSGSAKFTNGDVVVPELMIIECKTSMKEKESFSIKKEWIETNEYERISQQLPYGSLAISFSPEGTENYFVINEKLMKKLVSMLREE